MFAVDHFMQFFLVSRVILGSQFFTIILCCCDYHIRVVAKNIMFLDSLIPIEWKGITLHNQVGQKMYSCGPPEEAKYATQANPQCPY